MANVNIPDLTALTAPAAADVIEVYDDSAAANKKLALSYVALLGTANVFTANQTVGIGGTGTQNDSLIINGGSGASNFVELAIKRNGTYGMQFGIAGSANGLVTGAVSNDIVLVNNQSKAFLISVDGGASAGFAVASGGNVGIGTTGPISLLSNSNLNDGNVTANGFQWVTANTDNYVANFKSAKYGIRIWETSGTGDALVVTGKTTLSGTTSNLVVQGTGNSSFVGKVLIGTITDSGSKLDVAGGRLALSNGDFGGFLGLRFRNGADASTPNGGGIYQGSNNVLYIQAGADNGITFRNYAGTNVFELTTLGGTPTILSGQGLVFADNVIFSGYITKSRTYNQSIAGSGAWSSPVTVGAASSHVVTVTGMTTSDGNVTDNAIWLISRSNTSWRAEKVGGTSADHTVDLTSYVIRVNNLNASTRYFSIGILRTI